MLSALSPARRRLALGAAALFLTSVVAIAATVAVRQATGPAEEPVPPDRPGPVLLVPGYGGSTKALEVLAVRLRRAGRDAEIVPLPGGGIGDLRQQARVLGTTAHQAMNRARTASVDVVGYSAGGVVARLWASEGGRTVARRVITLGSPHHGTTVATLVGTFQPERCPLACQQLVPGSELLNR